MMRLSIALFRPVAVKKLSKKIGAVPQGYVNGVLVELLWS